MHFMPMTGQLDCEREWYIWYVYFVSADQSVGIRTNSPQTSVHSALNN